MNRATCGVLVVLASAAAARDVSFAEARTLSLHAAADVQLAERRHDVSLAEVDVVGALVNPTISLSTATQTARLGSFLSVPVPLFGQRSGALDAARADAAAVRLDVDVTRREARWAATVAWLDLWEAQERAQLLERGAEDAARVMDIASQRLDAGTGPRLDVLRTRVDQVRARAEAQAAQALSTAAAARLAPWLGVAPELALTAAGPPGYSTDPLQQLEGKQADVHPVLRRDLAQVEASGLHLVQEQRLRWPVLTPQVGVSAFDPTLPRPDVVVGLSFEVPVLSLRGGAIARAQAQRSLAEATADADARRLSALLIDALARSRSSALRRRALHEDVRPAMEEARAMTQDAYLAGRVDLLRLLEAQRALLEAQLAEVEATAAWGRALADVERAAGVDLQ
jgi:cobalt-zinc-cadmium efflux system outer membrane protein